MDFKNTVAPFIVGMIIAIPLIFLICWIDRSVGLTEEYSIVPIKGGYMVAIETNMPEAELRARVHNMLYPEGPLMVVPETIFLDDVELKD